MNRIQRDRLSRMRLPLLLAPGVAAIFVAAALAVSGVHAAGEPAIANEPGEEHPGGHATTRNSIDTREAFSHFSEGIGLEGEAKFKVGNAIFRKLWVSAPSSTTSSDGLGPLFNSRSCQNCHLKDGRGRPPTANFPDDTAESMFLRLSIPPQNEEQRRLLAEHRVATIDEPTYGEQLQNLAIQGHDNEGRMRIDYTEVPVTLADGSVVNLRHPAYSVEALKYGPLHPGTMLSPRIAPPVIGMGLLEAIPESDIRKRADPGDADKDGISGRTNEVWSADQQRAALGRFGWKAGKPSVADQAASAFAGDMGLSSPLAPRPSGDCTPAQSVCVNAPNGNTERDGGMEVSSKLFDHVVFYSQNLAVPPRRDFSDANVNRGKALFYALRCQSCHAPSFTTGKVEGQPHLSNQKIWPYTDLLLHDMGDGLADNRPEGAADGREWRTPPLWGIGLTRLVSGHTFFLHDGRARNIEEAILWHGGEAQAARDAYAALSKADREALIKFVESL
jgi:CxxC motif-containing protein (DUF1111 family)